MAKIRVDKAKRQLCAELLHILINYKLTHELWRINHIHKEGLTPKEIEYLESCRDDLEKIWQRLTKFSDRLRHSASK